MAHRLWCDAAHVVIEEVHDELQDHRYGNVHLVDDGVVQAIGRGNVVMMMKTPSVLRRVCLQMCGTFQL